MLAAEVTTMTTCPAETHDLLRSDPAQLIKLTTPGARIAHPERPGWYQETRHCIACGGTLTHEGQGESRRWLYAVAERKTETPRFYNVLEEVVRHLAEEGGQVAHVSRYVLGIYATERLTEGETRWLDDALAALGAIR